MGSGFIRDPRNTSATKKGPGRRHKQGRTKGKRPGPDSLEQA